MNIQFLAAIKVETNYRLAMIQTQQCAYLLHSHTVQYKEELFRELV